MTQGQASGHSTVLFRGSSSPRLPQKGKSLTIGGWLGFHRRTVQEDYFEKEWEQYYTLIVSHFMVMDRLRLQPVDRLFVCPGSTCLEDEM